MENSDFLWGLKINDALTTSLISQVSTIALGVAVICFICNIAYNYLKSGASNLLTSANEDFPDMMEISRCIVLFFCLTLYTPIAKTIVGTFEAINSATSLTSSAANEWEQAMAYYGEKEHGELATDDNELEQAQLSGAEYGSATEKIQTEDADNFSNNKTLFEKVANISKLLSPDNFAATLIHAVASILCGIIQVVIIGIIVVSLKILIILGPFAFAFSMLPCFQKQLSVWFGSICSIGIAFTVINILNSIMAQLFKNLWNADLSSLAGSGLRGAEMIAIDLAMVGAYCSVFWLSSKIVGHGDAGRMVSKTMGLVATAATVAIAGGAAAGGGGTPTNVGQASAAGRSIIDENK
ncbi:MAG: hypothetical protein LBJ72_01590 [Dysgonamonadaceae bacterium]|jgi:hypothetical protein|nr:hypothetical protein [Dysgonamonadaceae bacterium]